MTTTLDTRLCKVAVDPFGMVGLDTRSVPWFSDEDYEREARTLGACVIDLELVRGMLLRAAETVRQAREPLRVGSVVTFRVNGDPEGVVRRAIDIGGDPATGVRLEWETVG